MSETIYGDESELRCPCGGRLFDPGEGFPKEGDELECGSGCGRTFVVTCADWSLRLHAEAMEKKPEGTI